MFIMFTFKIKVGDRQVESPVMGAVDVTRLQALFPNNQIWKCAKSELGNQMFPTVRQMRYLYDALLKHFVKEVVSNEAFQTGNFTGSFAIVSSVRSLFKDLIGFCEKDIGFKRPVKLALAVSQREDQYRKEEMDAIKKLRAGALPIFRKLSRLKKPKDKNFLIRLRHKLDTYRARISTQTNWPPDLAFALEHGYRDTTYKIEVLSALLALKPGSKGLNFLTMMTKAMKKRGNIFFPDEYYNACAVIAHYAGQPFEGSIISKQLS